MLPGHFEYAGRLHGAFPVFTLGISVSWGFSPELVRPGESPDNQQYIIMASVFILDNDRDTREMLCAVYEISGVRSCVTAPSVEAMKGEENSVLNTNLAVLDMNLGPGQPSGTDAYRWLMDHHYQGKVVILTGHGISHPLVKDAARCGVPVLEKPVDIDTLMELLR